MRVAARIERYIQKIQSYSTLRFIVELSIVAKVLGFVSIPLFMIEAYVTKFTYKPEVGHYSNVELIILFIIFFPLLETFLGQMGPILALSKFTKNKWKIILSSAIFFALLHIHPDIHLAYIVAIFLAGLVYATAFFIKKQSSLKSAYFITASIHGLFNMYALLFQFFLP